ncbi:MAG: hypothetical protein LBT92_00855 [Rickettsiales bacterium]|nr:hypothetical protein [Rickettsiales bacterium]
MQDDSNLPAFSDFSEEAPPFEGEKKFISDIINKEITVVAHKVVPSKKRPGDSCLYLSLRVDGSLGIMFSGSAVLRDLCEKYKHKMPFRTKIIKVDKYYTFA